MTTAQAARLKAALLAFETQCEVCKKRPALVLFDSTFVCAGCRRRLNDQLRKEGKRNDLRKGRTLVSGGARLRAGRL